MNVILDPVFIPPLNRVHLNSIDLHREVQMIAAGEARGTGFAHGLATLHQVALFNGELA